MAIYTIWPATKEGEPASSSHAWRQASRWLVLDVTGGLDDAHIMAGPITRSAALKRELELRVEARKAKP
jgi:hypothetical protein